MDLAKLDFQQLRVRHIAHKSKVRSVLYGGNYDHEYFEDENPVSQWFATIGWSKYGNEPWLGQLNRLHRDFSALANELINSYERDLIEQAHAGLADLSAASELFLRTLTKVEQHYS